MKAKSKIKINKGKLISKLVMLCILLLVANVFVGLVRYPEQYLTTWKYQFENDLSKGNQDAIRYYNDTYVANGKYLFGDKYIVETVNCFTN